MRWCGEYRHNNDGRYGSEYWSGPVWLFLHHVQRREVGGHCFSKTVEKTAQTGATPEGIRSVL